MYFYLLFLNANQGCDTGQMILCEGCRRVADLVQLPNEPPSDFVAVLTIIRDLQYHFFSFSLSPFQ